jgi:hypothetical protein
MEGGERERERETTPPKKKRSGGDRNISNSAE